MPVGWQSSLLLQGPCCMRGLMQGSPCVFVEMWVALFSSTRESPKSAICMHSTKAWTRQHLPPIDMLHMQRKHLIRMHDS